MARPALVMMCQGFGSLPTRNFSSGQFEGAEKISGEVLRQTLLERGGDCEVSHACMAGCTIRSSNVFGDVERQGGGIAAGIRDHRPDGLQPGHRRPGCHRPLELRSQRPGAGQHRDRRGPGRGGGGRPDAVRRRRAGLGAAERNPPRHAAGAPAGQRRRPSPARCWASSASRWSRTRPSRLTTRAPSRAPA